MFFANFMKSCKKKWNIFLQNGYFEYEEYYSKVKNIKYYWKTAKNDQKWPKKGFQKFSLKQNWYFEYEEYIWETPQSLEKTGHWEIWARIHRSALLRHVTKLFHSWHSYDFICFSCDFIFFSSDFIWFWTKWYAYYVYYFLCRMCWVVCMSLSVKTMESGNISEELSSPANQLGVKSNLLHILPLLAQVSYMVTQSFCCGSQHWLKSAFQTRFCPPEKGTNPLALVY